MAGRQHGVVARRQLLALGLGARAVEERIGRGRLHRIHRGVYAVGHRAQTWEGKLMAAVLASGPGAVLSHRSAGQLHGVVPRFATDVEVTRPTSARSVAGVRSHRAQLPADETTEVERIPATTAARVVFDLAAISPPREVERAFHELEVRRLWGPLSVRDLLKRYPGHRGVATLRAVLDSKRPVGITRNDFEERFVAALDANGLPRPRFNATIWVRGRFFEPDALWEAQRLIVELDGGEVHRTQRAFQSDRQRDRILLAEGWRTARVTWHQLRDEPLEVVADLRRVLEPNPPIPPVPQSRYPHPPAK